MPNLQNVLKSLGDFFVSLFAATAHLNIPGTTNHHGSDRSERNWREI